MNNYWIAPDADGVASIWMDDEENTPSILVREDQVDRHVWATLKVGVRHE